MPGRSARGQCLGTVSLDDGLYIYELRAWVDASEDLREHELPDDELERWLILRRVLERGSEPQLRALVERVQDRFELSREADLGETLAGLAARRVIVITRRRREIMVSEPPPEPLYAPFEPDPSEFSGIRDWVVLELESEPELWPLLRVEHELEQWPGLSTQSPTYMAKPDTGPLLSVGHELDPVLLEAEGSLLSVEHELDTSLAQSGSLLSVEHQVSPDLLGGGTGQGSGRTAGSGGSSQGQAPDSGGLLRVEHELEPGVGAGLSVEHELETTPTDRQR